MIHLVQFSTGVGSAEDALRCVETGEPTVLMTADTLVEDHDNWRFAFEVWDYLGKPEWIYAADGRTPMQVGADEGIVPNDRMAVCSRQLKRELLRRIIEDRYDPSEVVIHEGYDWTETRRYETAIPHWSPYALAPPVMDGATKPQILDRWRARGIEPPRLYAAGYSHANCGGACVRGGAVNGAVYSTKTPTFTPNGRPTRTLYELKSGRTTLSFATIPAQRKTFHDHSASTAVNSPRRPRCLTRA